MNPKISVLTCCFNAERFVSESIFSILNQTCGDFEYIIVDDGSVDGTAGLLKEFGERDRRVEVYTKSNTGFTDSLNFGLEKASGDWIARLDADDIALPDRLEKQLHRAEQDDSLVLLGGGCVEIDGEGNTVKSHRYPDSHHELLSRLEKTKPFFPHSSAFIRRSRLVEMGGYDRRYVRSQDCDLFLRMAETGEIGCLHVPVVKLRKHSGMVSNIDSGRLQHLYGAVAVFCHYRRKLGLEDPSAYDDEQWNSFLRWAEERLEEQGYFDIFREWKNIRSYVYSDGRRKSVSGYVGLLIDLLSRKEGRRAIWYRIAENRCSYELARQYDGMKSTVGGNDA